MQEALKKNGASLKELRRSAGLSQADVADILGYTTPQFISNWERGVSNPPITAMVELGDIYKVPPKMIFEATLKATLDETERSLRRKFDTQMKKRTSKKAS